MTGFIQRGKYKMRLKLNIAFYLLFILAFPIFSQEKINHDNDVWYQLILIPVEEERAPYTFEWIWHNTSWRDVIGFVEPRKMLNGSFKMSDFVFMNPSSRMGVELHGALSIFENNKLTEGNTYIIGDINYHVKKNGVIWQPDKTFLLMLVKLDVCPKNENDSGYDWW